MARFNAEKTHCKYEHEFTESNTYVAPNGYRYCRTCKNNRTKRYLAGEPRPETYTCVVCATEIPLRSTKSKYCSEICSKLGHAKQARIRLLMQLYGLALSEFDELLVSQNNSCAICKVGFENRQIAVDHDHVTGITRGLLCWNCNHKLLPPSKDDPSILRSAADYLEHPPAVSLLGERIGEKAVIKGVRRKKKRYKKRVKSTVD